MKKTICLFLLLSVLVLWAGTEYQPKPLTFRGKPFFMLGNEDSRMEKNRRSVHPVLKGCGMNTVMCTVDLANPEKYQSDLKEIQWFARNYPDMAVIIDLPLDYILQNAGKKKWGNAPPEIQKQRLPVIEKALKDLRACGNVIGYSIDELENRVHGTLGTWEKSHPSKKDMDSALTDYMEACTDWIIAAIRKHHPEALFMPIQAWWTTYDKSAKLYDVLIADQYPVTGDQKKNPTLYSVAYDAQQAAAASEKLNKRCFVYMPAGFNVLNAGAWKGMREYTLEELRYMWFTPVSSGAMGILGWRQRRCTNDFAFRKIFLVMNEINSLVPWLLGENMDSQVTSKAEHPFTEYKVRKRSRMMGKEDDEFNIRPVKTITWIARKNPADKTLMILACNNSGENESCTFKAPSAYTSCTELYSGNSSRLKGEFKVKFSPLSVKIFILHTETKP